VFAFQQLIAGSRRTALGFAAIALAVTALVAPASTARAATPDPSIVMSVQQADLRAVAVGKTAVNGGFEYSFSVTNAGPATAPMVYVYQEAILVGGANGLATQYQDNRWVTVGSLAPGKSYPIKVYCKQSLSYKCSQGDIFVKLGAGPISDPNPNDNSAAIK